MEGSISSGSGFLQTAVGALTLRDETFRALTDDARPFVRGLLFIVIIGLVVALASIVGTVLTEWTSPNMDSIRDAIVEGIHKMPWWSQIPPDALDKVNEAFDQQFNFVWQIIGMATPSIPKAVSGIVVQPLVMVVVWLVFGLVAFLFAKALSGTGSLAQTYGATSLAAAPYLLGIVHVLPYVQAAGLSAWALICAYLGVKHAHDLSPGRAFWATFLALAVMFIVATSIGVGAVAAIAISQFGVGGAGQ